jgi:hypothetical protein
MGHVDPHIGVLVTRTAVVRAEARQPVRIQWDPDRSITLTPLSHRAIQIGLSGEAVRHYLDNWITTITNVTPFAARIRHHVISGDLGTAQAELPAEQVYPLPAPIRSLIGATDT